MENDLINFLKHLNITDYDISSLQNLKGEYRPKGIHYREYYDEETQNHVYKHHKIEFDLFGYIFDYK